MRFKIDDETLWLDPDGICFLAYTPHEQGPAGKNLRPASLRLGWLGGQKWELKGRAAEDVYRRLATGEGPLAKIDKGGTYEARRGDEKSPTVS